MIPVFHTAHIDFASQHQDAIRELMLAQVPRTHRPKEAPKIVDRANYDGGRSERIRIRDAVVEMHNSGISATRIAEKFGRSQYYIRCIVREAEAEGISVKAYARLFSRAKVKRDKIAPKVMALHREGLSLTKIAIKIGVSRGVVARIIREAGA